MSSALPSQFTKFGLLCAELDELIRNLTSRPESVHPEIYQEHNFDAPEIHDQPKVHNQPKNLLIPGNLNTNMQVILTQMSKVRFSLHSFLESKREDKKP